MSSTLARRRTKSAPTDENLEVVFIGDDLSVAELYRLKLELDGYWETTCATVDDGLKRILSRMPDLVFVDLGPDGGRKPERLGTLRSDYRLQDLPIVLLAHGDFEAGEPKAFRLGGRDFLVRIDSLPGANFWRRVATLATGSSAPALEEKRS